jgi:hypothetical protein
MNAGVIQPKADRTLPAPRFAWLLAAFFAVAYPGLLIGARTLFFRDFGVIAYPVISYEHDCFWRGEFPLWDPYSHCGAPFAAQWGAMCYYPFSAIYLVLPPPWSLSLFWMAHLYLGGVGMFLLARRYCGNSVAAGLAGLAFAFNGLVFSSLAWPNYSVALGWMPWTVLLAEAAWRKGGRHLAGAALAGAFQMLSGVPEIVLLTWALLGLLWAREFLAGPTPRLLLASRHFGVVALVAGLCSVQLLPFFDLLSRSQRDSAFGSSGWAMPAWGWANLVAPLFHAARSPQGVYYLPRHIFITSYYLGLAWTTLAVFAAVLPAFPRKKTLLLAAGGAMVLSLGDDGFVFPLLKSTFPQLGFARYPIKFFYLASFCLPLLAARGAAAVLDAPPEDQVVRRRFRRTIGGALAVAAALVAWAGVLPLPADHWPEMALNTAVRAALTLGAGFGLLRFPLIASPRRRAFLAAGLLAALWLDAVAYSPNLVPTLPTEVFAPVETPLRPAPALGESRAMVSPYAEERLYASRVPDFQNDLLGKRLGLWANLNLLDLVPKADGGLTLQIREESQVEAAVRSGTNDYPNLLDFLGVRQITAPGKIVDWRERTNSLPWATAGQKPLFVAPGRALEAVLAPGFDPRRQVILEETADPAVRSLKFQQAASVQKAYFARQSARIQVSSPAATVLTVAQTWHPNWRANVDGQPATILRANHAFQAVLLPPGAHEVRLSYEDRQMKLGGAISLVSLLASLALAAAKPRRET